MQEFVKYGEKKGASFVEIKEEIGENTRITVMGKDVKEIIEPKIKLYSAKVIYNGQLGLAYSDQPDFKKLVDRAISVSKILDKKADYQRLQPYVKKFKTSYEIDPKTIPLEEKKETLLRLANQTGFKKIKSVEIHYWDHRSVYRIVNSEGTDLEARECRMGVLPNAFAKDGKEIENYYNPLTGIGGYEIMNSAEKKVKEACEMAEKLLKAGYAVGGEFPVVLDYRLGGVFTHEAIGHACEADAILQGASILKDKLGKKIASEIVTIVDDGTINANGWIPFDDEGIESQRTLLIENGILKGFMHSRETAVRMGVKPTGNGRAESLKYRTIPRMRNTFILPGKDKFEDMIKSIKNGYYLLGSKGGSVDCVKGEFLFNSVFGYEIKNGEIGKMVKGPSLMGNIIEIMPKINMIDSKLEYGQGRCGKAGQWVPVGDGSPNFKIDKARVGGK